MTIFSNLRQDIPASIVVFFVAVPLCLGIALASGAPLLSGLIAGVVGGILVGSLSGSQLGVSGPAAGLTVIVLVAIEELGFEAFLVSVVLAGVLQLLFAFLRAGFIAFFFPTAVIKGMLAGIGLIIILKQIPHALGHDSDPEGQMDFIQPDGETTFSSLSIMANDFEFGALIIALSGLAIILFWEIVLAKKYRLFQIIQGPLVAVAFGISFQMLAVKYFPALALDATHLVSMPIFEGTTGFTQLMTFPEWNRIFDGPVLITAVTLALVASLETLLCVEATDKLDPLKRITPTNRELFAQGCGNCVSGLIGGLPITQVIVRSSANIQSGGKTKLSAILHGILLLVSVLLLPTLLNLIPLAVLASILFVVGYKLAKPAIFKDLYKAGMDQFIPFVATIAGILLTDLLLGIMIGMSCALFMILRRNFLNAFELNIEDHESSDHTHKVTIKLAEEISFFSRAAIVDALSKVSSGSHVIIDANGNRHIDPDIRDVIHDFETGAKHRNIRVNWANTSQK